MFHTLREAFHMTWVQTPTVVQLYVLFIYCDQSFTIAQKKKKRSEFNFEFKCTRFTYTRFVTHALLTLNTIFNFALCTLNGFVLFNLVLCTLNSFKLCMLNDYIFPVRGLY